MYDPFATPPPPGMVSATAVPQQPQVNQVSPNNALSALYNKHMQNLMPNGQFPLNPGMQGQPGPDGWRQAFQQARTDWRGDRPTFDGAMPNDWRTQMGDWRDQRPVRRDFRMGTMPTPTPSGV